MHQQRGGFWTKYGRYGRVPLWVRLGRMSDRWKAAWLLAVMALLILVVLLLTGIIAVFDTS